MEQAKSVLSSAGANTNSIYVPTSLIISDQTITIPTQQDVLLDPPNQVNPINDTYFSVPAGMLIWLNV